MKYCDIEPSLPRVAAVRFQTEATTPGVDLKQATHLIYKRRVAVTETVWVVCKNYRSSN